MALDKSGKQSTTQPENGQSTAEFALVTPILILLLAGVALAAQYAFRAASADLGVFATGVAHGSYKSPASEQARTSTCPPFGVNLMLLERRLSRICRSLPSSAQR